MAPLLSLFGLSFSSTFLLLALTPLWLLYTPPPATSTSSLASKYSSSTSSSSLFSFTRGLTLTRPLVWLHVALALLATLWSDELLSTVLTVLFSSTGTGVGYLHLTLNPQLPSHMHTLLIAAKLLVFVLAVWPVPFHHFPQLRVSKSVLLGLLLLALSLLVIQPETQLNALFAFSSPVSSYAAPYSGSSPTSAAAAALSSVSTAQRWAGWALLASIVLLLSALTPVLPLNSASPEARLIFGTCLGGFVGLYLSLSYFPPMVFLYLFNIAIAGALVSFVVLVHWPSPATDPLSPILFSAFLALLPVQYLCLGQELRYYPRKHGQDVLLLCRTVLVSLYAASCLLLALLAKLKLLAQRKAQRMQRWSSSTESQWLTLVANISAVAGFLLCLVLNIHFFQASDLSVILLSPLLLLLHPSPRLLPAFTEDRRYFPLVLAVVAYLFLSPFYHLVLKGPLIWVGHNILPLSTLQSLSPVLLTPFEIAKNIVLLVLPLPSLISTLKFVWKQTKQSEFMLASLIPLNILPIIMPDLVAIRALGVLGIVSGCVNLYWWRSIRTRGMKLI